jgi:hypothetical protein
MLAPYAIALSLAVLALFTARALAPSLGSLRFGRRALAAVLVWGCAAAWIHARFPRQHRLYYDEDAYANLSLNLIRGHGAGVTLLATRQAHHVERYKWPYAFPTAAAPLVAWLGPETGPEVFNELCGAAAIAVAMAWAAALAESFWAAILVAPLMLLQPAAIEWFRSGSAEPLSALLAALALWAAAKAGAASAPGISNGRWVGVSALAAAIAIHVRLENLVLAIPLVLIPGARKRLWSLDRVSAIPLLFAAMLAIAYVAHLGGLRQYYLAGRGESSFGAAWVGGNLAANLKYLGATAASTSVVLAAGVLAWAAVRRRRIEAGAILCWPAAIFALLLFYSVGQFGYPGGGRFLLPFALAGSALAASGCLAAPRRMVLLAVPLAVALLAAQAAGAWPHGTVYGTDVPRAEHAAIVRWAARLPRDAVVISRVPYLWENLGVYTAQPEFAGGILEQTRNLYLHIGLFSTPAERASVENWPKQCVSTAAGEIWLVSHP